MPAFKATVLTLFPEMFPGPLAVSLAGKALAAGAWTLEARDIRDFAPDRHRSVDDRPAGGGSGNGAQGRCPGRRHRCGRARRGYAAAVADERPRRALDPGAGAGDRGGFRRASRMSPVSKGWTNGWSTRRNLREVSIGDFVLSGGEPAAIALLDAVVRLLPGVMGDAASAAVESFADGLLEYPQYTRPRMWEGEEIPPVLLAGDHQAIERWKREQAEEATRQRRPDLWAAFAKRRTSEE